MAAVLCDEQRIPLPYKCCNRWATQQDGCQFFHGKKFIEYNNGEVWCHIELLKDTNDSFQYRNEDAMILHARNVAGSVHNHPQPHDNTFPSSSFPP